MPKESGEKVDRRVRRTKKLLMQALIALLRQKQLQEITVKELTELADMNRGTFYLYYRDIHDMLQKIEDGLFEQLDAILTLPETTADRTDIRPVLKELFIFVGENREMFRVLFSPNGDISFIHRLNSVLRERCLALSLEKSADGMDLDYPFSFVLYGLAGLLRAWSVRGCVESPEQMADLADRLIRRGAADAPEQT